MSPVGNCIHYDCNSKKRSRVDAAEIICLEPNDAPGTIPRFYYIVLPIYAGYPTLLFREGLMPR